MNRNNISYNDILKGLQGQQPALKNPDEMMNRVMERINEKPKQPAIVIAMRICALAASLLLLFGWITHTSVPSPDTALLAYQNQVLSQKRDYSYYYDKFLRKSIFDNLKHQNYENND